MATIGLRWTYSKWRLNTNLHYTDSYLDDLSGLREDTLDQFGLTADSVVKVDSWTTVDLNISYDFSPDSWLTFDIDNLFDERAPFAFGAAPGVDFYNHDTMGRYYTLRYTQRF